jgi:hypothetical protein
MREFEALETNCNGVSLDAVKKHYVIACHVLWRELCYFASLSRNVHQFVFLRQGLHCAPDLLRTELQRAIDAVDEDDCAAILVGYGLCSNGLVGIRAGKVKLVVMRGHDCITFLLGSKERYREYFDSHPGTYWYSPGWIDTSTQPGKDRYEKVLRHYVETYGEENAEYLMRASENWMDSYSNAAYVDLGVGDAGRYRDFTRECSEWLNWKCDFLEGDSVLMMDFLEGRWDDERFLVVQPGETVAASYDEKIIKAVSC